MHCWMPDVYGGYCRSGASNTSNVLDLQQESSTCLNTYGQACENYDDCCSPMRCWGTTCQRACAMASDCDGFGSGNMVCNVGNGGFCEEPCATDADCPKEGDCCGAHFSEVNAFCDWRNCWDKESLLQWLKFRPRTQISPFVRIIQISVIIKKLFNMIRSNSNSNLFFTFYPFLINYLLLLQPNIK